jgi:hypothetical protein
MSPSIRALTVALGVAAAVAPVHADIVVPLFVDLTQSSADFEFCLDPAAAASACGAYETSLFGFVEMTLDSASPTAAAVSDFQVLFLQGQTVLFNFAPLGFVTLSFREGGVIDPTPGPPAILPGIAADGGFSGLGDSELSGEGFLSGQIGPLSVSQAFEITAPPTTNTYSGQIAVALGEVTVTVEVPVSAVQSVANVGSFSADGTLRLVATGTLSCPADITGDNQTDSGDLSAFVTAFLAQTRQADLTGDGQVDSGDLAAFINFFLEGC